MSVTGGVAQFFFYLNARLRHARRSKEKRTAPTADRYRQLQPRKNKRNFTEFNGILRKK